MALILEHTGPPEEAERFLRRAIYLDRGFALAHYHLARLLLARKRTQQARKAFENVLELLARQPADQVLEHGDQITASELRESVRVHLEILDRK
jgi:chemotaxis protein methyltransferase CheR